MTFLLFLGLNATIAKEATGRVGPLFCHCVVPLNVALVSVVVAAFLARQACGVLITGKTCWNPERMWRPPPESASGRVNMARSIQSKPEYHLAPPGWIPEDPNPFSEDGKYGDGWTCFFVRGDDGPTWYGAEPSGLFAFRAGRELGVLDERIADFLRYEGAQGRVPILSLPEDVDGRVVAERALSGTPLPGRLRASDPRWVVHSTSAEAWERIRADGALRAPADLAEDGIAVENLGFTQLGEPPEYAEYAVLGRLDSHASEIVVASRQAGTIRDDPNLPYEPGVRIYFDNHAIISAGLGERDGMHTVKVHRRLPLEPFFSASVSASDLEEPGLRTPWTPTVFLREANEAFLRRADAGDPRLGRGCDRAERRGKDGTHDEG